MQTIRVLIVDDEPDIADTLSMILQLRGLDTATAEHGADALARLRSDFLASIILLDMMMPVMDGQTFLEELGRIPGLSEIPVVVFSGDHERAAAAHGRMIVARLCKPIEIDPLIELIAAHAIDPSLQPKGAGTSATIRGDDGGSRG